MKQQLKSSATQSLMEQVGAQLMVFLAGSRVEAGEVPPREVAYPKEPTVPPYER